MTSYGDLLRRMAVVRVLASAGVQARAVTMAHDLVRQLAGDRDELAVSAP
jgi:hypothetical protein